MGGSCCGAAFPQSRGVYGQDTKQLQAPKFSKQRGNNDSCALRCRLTEVQGVNWESGVSPAIATALALSNFLSVACRYLPEKNVFVWKIKQYPGQKEFIMRAHFGLPSIESGDRERTKEPISVKFEIPYFTVSGIQVPAKYLLQRKIVVVYASFLTGALPQNYREEWVQRVALGPLYYAKWRLSNQIMKSALTWSKFH